MIPLCVFFTVLLFSGCASDMVAVKDPQDLMAINGSLKVGYGEVPYTQLATTMDTVESREGRLFVRPFEIDLELTDQAQKALRERNESIVLSFIFHGDWKTPRSDSNVQYFSDGYGFVVRKEVPVQKLYRIDDLEIPRDFYEPLPDKDVSIVLNIISGRKSSENNLLKCDILVGRFSELVGRRFYLKGDLIRPPGV